MNDNPLVQLLKEVCLFLVESSIEYMLVGGLAVGIWSKPRATVDIGLLVSTQLDDFEVLKCKLEEANKFVFIHDRPMIFGKISFLRTTLKSNTDISVDFLFADDDFKNEALKRRETVRVDDFTVNIATAEDLIILKLLANRPQDNLDAKNILESQRENLDMKYILKWSEKLGIEL